MVCIVYWSNEMYVCALRSEHNFRIYIPPLHIITHYYCHHRNGCSIIFKRALSCAQRQTMAIDDAMAEWIEKYLRINKWYEKVLLSIRRFFPPYLNSLQFSLSPSLPCSIHFTLSQSTQLLTLSILFFHFFYSFFLPFSSFSVSPSLSSLFLSPPRPPQNSIFVWLLFIVIQNKRDGKRFNLTTNSRRFWSFICRLRQILRFERRKTT